MHTLYNNIRHLLLCLLMLAGSQMTWAQFDDYNPTLPAEPGVVVMSHLYLVSDPAGGCTFNRTSGAAYLVGSSVTVKATVAAKHEFLGWYQGDLLVGQDLTYTVTEMPYHDMTLTARLRYIPDPVQYTVTAVANDPNSCTVTGGGTYQVGKSVTLKATPKSGAYKFSHWTKNGVRTNLAQNFTFTLTEEDGDLSFEAWYDFEPTLPSEPGSDIVKSYLYFESDPAEACTFSITSGIAVNVGSSVSIKATPKIDYVFKGWHQDDLLVGQDLTYTIAEMPYKDIRLVASWDYVPTPCYRVTAAVGDGVGGTVSCTGSKVRDGLYEAGSLMTIKCTTESKYTFLYWTKNGVPTDLPKDFTFILTADDGDLSFEAWFDYDPMLPNEPTGTQDDVDCGVILGDVNGDERVSIADVVALVAHLRGHDPASYNASTADVNQDGEVDADDIKALINMLLQR